MGDAVPQNDVQQSILPILKDRTGGKTHNAVAILTASQAVANLVTTGYEWLTLKARMTAGAAPDLALEVRAFEDDGSTLFDVVLPADASVAPALSGGVSRTFQRIRLGGAAKVEVRAKNANAGTQTATVSYDLQR